MRGSRHGHAQFLRCKWRSHCVCLVVRDGIEMGKCSFNTAWLKDERYSKWLSADRTNKHAAFCRVCERVILLTTMGIKAVDSHMKSEKHRKSIATSDKKVISIANYMSVGGASATPSAASSSKATSDIKELEQQLTEKIDELKHLP